MLEFELIKFGLFEIFTFSKLLYIRISRFLMVRIGSGMSSPPPCPSEQLVETQDPPPPGFPAVFLQGPRAPTVPSVLGKCCGLFKIGEGQGHIFETQEFPRIPVSPQVLGGVQGSCQVPKGSFRGEVVSVRVVMAGFVTLVLFSHVFKGFVNF